MAELLEDPVENDDPYNLERFVTAQNAGGSYEHAVEELRRGHKTSHWMWYVFPQIAGLGQSEMSRTYAIASLDEARAYLRHQVLGPPLRAAAMRGARSAATSARGLVGRIDAPTLRAPRTLFLPADPDAAAFR